MENKITVKHFLNTRVKPSIKQGSKEKNYPIYCEITYKGQNTQFNFEWDYHLKQKDQGYFQNRYTEEILKKIKSKYEKTILEIEDEIKSIIQFEESIYKKDFTLKGFKDRYNFYTDCFSCLIQSEISEAIFEELEKRVGRKDYYHIEEEAILYGLLKLIRYVEKKHVPNFGQEIENETWIKIHTYYLVNSFKASNRDARHFGFWIYKNGFELFEKYLLKEKHLKKSNPLLKKIKKLNLSESKTYIKAIHKIINNELINNNLRPIPPI